MVSQKECTPSVTSYSEWGSGCSKPQLTDLILYWKTSFEKNCFFWVDEYAEYGYDQQRLIWYGFRLWHMVFSPSEFRRRANAQNVS